jgi:hypothetical protein
LKEVATYFSRLSFDLSVKGTNKEYQKFAKIGYQIILFEEMSFIDAFEFLSRRDLFIVDRDNGTIFSSLTKEKDYFGPLKEVVVARKLKAEEIGKRFLEFRVPSKSNLTKEERDRFESFLKRTESRLLELYSHDPSTKQEIKKEWGKYWSRDEIVKKLIGDGWKPHLSPRDLYLELIKIEDEDTFLRVVSSLLNLLKEGNGEKEITDYYVVFSRIFNGDRVPEETKDKILLLTNKTVSKRLYLAAGLDRSILVWKTKKSLPKPKVTKRGLVEVLERNPEFFDVLF